MARGLALAVATAAALLAVSGAGGGMAQKPQRGGTVALAFLEEPPCLNPLVATCGTYPGFTFWNPLSLVLLTPFESAPSGWRPSLVSHVRLARDPFTVTYTLRRDAHWSDGVPVTAADYVFSLRMSLRHLGRSLVDPDGVIRGVTGVDTKTVRITFRSRYAGWRRILNISVLPRHVLAREGLATIWKDAIDDPKTGEPIGDGPFLVQSWTKGRQLVLVRNPHYWGPHSAYLQRLVFRFTSDPSAALRSGDVDVLALPAPGQAPVLELARHPEHGIKVLSTPGAGWEHFDIRVVSRGQPALANKLVRRALAYGINREALVRALYGDIAPRLRPLDNTVYLANVPEYKPNWRIYRYRPALARRLLEQAGCRLGSDEIYVCAGVRLSLRFVTTAGSPERAQTLQIVQAQLQKVGINVTPVYASSWPSLLGSGDFDVALFAWLNTVPEQVDSPYRCGDNPGGYCSRLVTSDLSQSDRIVDPERQSAVANRADRRLAQDVPVIPLFQSPLFVAFRDTIHGVVPDAFLNPTWNAENWWIER